MVAESIVVSSLFAALISYSAVLKLTHRPKVVEDYRSGKKQAAGFLVGQVMKATRGQANPGKVNELLARELEA